MADLTRQEIIKYLLDAQISSEKVSLNFTGFNLLGLDLSKLDLSNIIFSKANLTDTNFDGANLRNADFSDSILSKTNFANSNLDNAKFSTIENPSILNKTSLMETTATLWHLDAKDCKFSGENIAFLNDINLQRCHFSKLNPNTEIKQSSKIISSTFEDCKFEIDRNSEYGQNDIDFSSTIFLKCYFYDWEISNSNLNRILFSCPIINFGSFKNCDLTQSEFFLFQITNSIFENCNFTNAEFTNSDKPDEKILSSFNSTIFKGSNISCKFKGIAFIDTKIENCNLENIEFDNCWTDDVDFFKNCEQSNYKVTEKGSVEHLAIDIFSNTLYKNKCELFKIYKIE